MFVKTIDHLLKLYIRFLQLTTSLLVSNFSYVFELHNPYYLASQDMVCMGQNAGYIKRDKLDILLGILEIANVPVKKTHILYKANINFYQLTRYLDLLLGLEMLEKINQPYNGYRITEKGRQMLHLFNHDGLDIGDNHKKKSYQTETGTEVIKRIPASVI